MTQYELNVLVEELINIRDRDDMSFKEKEVLADACNVIYKNINKLSEG